MPKFERKLPSKGIEHLKSMSKGDASNWWKDLLRLWAPAGTGETDRGPVRLAIRKNSLNFYLMGQSIARVSFRRDGRPYAAIHPKYFNLNIEGRQNVILENDLLHLPGTDKPIRYSQALIAQWTTEARSYGSEEKNEVDCIVSANSSIVDLEIGLTAWQQWPTAQRIDFSALQYLDDREIGVNFFEVKLISDGRLRSNSPEPEVVFQLRRYQAYIEAHKLQITCAYRQLAETLIEIASMACDSGNNVSLNPLISRAAEKNSVLNVNTSPILVIPHPGIVMPSGWMQHEEKLRQSSFPLFRLLGKPYTLPLNVSHFQ